MVRIDCLIFGYRKILIPPEKLSLATSILLRASILSSIGSNGTLIVRERDVAKISELFNGRIDFECSEPLGLVGRCKRINNKITYAVATVISTVLIIFLSNLVWDVRIEGNLNIPDSDIILRLSECGLGIGDLWPTMDRSRIESKYLENDERIINITVGDTVLTPIKVLK